MQQIKIKVKGQLDLHWSAWLEGLTIMHTGENETTLTGTAADPQALYGLLTKLRDLSLTLTYVSAEELPCTAVARHHEKI